MREVITSLMAVVLIAAFLIRSGTIPVEAMQSSRSGSGAGSTNPGSYSGSEGTYGSASGGATSGAGNTSFNPIAGTNGSTTIGTGSGGDSGATAVSGSDDNSGSGAASQGVSSGDTAKKPK
jgi:hypothetical protein